MRTIWKWSAGDESVVSELNGNYCVKMPHDAKPVHFALQHGRPTVWMQVETTAPLVRHVFTIVGTGWETPADGRFGQCEYVGTVLDGPYAWHLYYKGQVE